jgi:GNAT superfamily N-acetyltransferase
LSDIPRSQGQRSRQIENCRGDFEEVSRLIERSWAENTQQALLYSADFLASCFEYPGASFSLAPAIYDGSTPLAFAAAFPRRVCVKRRELNLVIITFLTVASEFKKRGYGILLWRELVKRARAAGFDGMVNYCVEGESMNGMILGCCQMLQLPTACVYTIPYWSRMLQPKKVQSAQADPAEDVIERFLGLTDPIAKQTPLARLWSRKEAEWQCQGRFGSVVAELESGSRRGMLVGYIMPVANANRTKCLIVEDVLWGDLESQERDSLVKALLDRAALGGAQMAVAPYLGYADFAPFHAARFRPSQKALHAYLTLWNGEACTETLSSMYLDVF